MDMTAYGKNGDKKLTLLNRHRWNCMWKNSDQTIKDNNTSGEGLNACMKCLHSIMKRWKVFNGVCVCVCCVCLYTCLYAFTSMLLWVWQKVSGS